VSLLHLDNPRIRVLALKKAEDTDETVVRLVELDGQAEPDVHLGFASPAREVRELNGQEQAINPSHPARIVNGQVVVSFTPYQPRTLAVRLAPLTAGATLSAQPLALAYNLAAATPDHTPTTAGFDGAGASYPAEMLPRRLDYAGLSFQLADPAGPDAVTAQGQSVALPAGRFTRLYLLAAATGGDQSGEFTVGSHSVSLNIEDWTGYIGQWDYRDWSTHTVELPAGRGGRGGRGARAYTYQLYAGLHPGTIKRAPVAWFASHHHLADGSNDAYSYAYIFAYEINLPAGATSLTLPNNPNIRIFAAAVTNAAAPLTPAQPLYDVLPYALTAAEKAGLYSQGPGPDAAFYHY
ncbi:MAG: glycosyl hydrolase-related protein, partial [Terriglobales bacterium]